MRIRGGPFLDTIPPKLEDQNSQRPLEQWISTLTVTLGDEFRMLAAKCVETDRPEGLIDQP